MEKQLVEQEVVVIGAGQAGLAMGNYLRQQQRTFVILDAGSSIGSSWRYRYDSLRLFTPAPFNSLAGLPFPGSTTYFPTKDEVADYLQRYAIDFELPVVLQQPVQQVERHHGLYFVETPDRVYLTRQVIVCTGAFHSPAVPKYSQHLPASITQWHSSNYQNATQLQPGKTLVVGGGNSGFQIAEELVQQGREVYFSFRDELQGTGSSAWLLALLFKSGLVHASKYSWLGKRLQARPEPIMSGNLRKVLTHPNLHKVGATTGADASGIRCETGRLQDVANIIWATGYTSDFSWIKVPVFDALGQPLHHRGVTPSQGLYFLGLPWLHSRSSGLLGGVSRDAAYLATHVKIHAETSKRAPAFVSC